MKKMIWVGSSILFYLMISCSKIEPDFIPEKRPDTLMLRNKPLPIINFYLQGKWQLHYIYGGGCGACVNQRDQYHHYWTFDGDTRIVQEFQGVITTDTVIDWYRAKSFLGDSTYILHFLEKNGTSNAYVVDRLIKDSLVLMDDSSDPAKYYFTKIK